MKWVGAQVVEDLNVLCNYCGLVTIWLRLSGEGGRTEMKWLASRWSKSSPPRCVSPAVAFTSKMPSSIVSSDTCARRATASQSGAHPGSLQEAPLSCGGWFCKQCRPLCHC